MKDYINEIFNIENLTQFNNLCLKAYKYQYSNNIVYKNFVDYLGASKLKIKSYKDIPMLPVEFFKTEDVVTFNKTRKKYFESSGTSLATIKSHHYIKSLTLYEKSISQSFIKFFGNPENYIFIALTPDSISHPHSSLAYMIDFLIKKSKSTQSGFYLNKESEMLKIIKNPNNKKTLFIFGLTYALLDFSEKNNISSKNIIVLETGGMKGQRKEITKAELYDILKKNFNIQKVYSEYSMSELISQAYSVNDGKYLTPPWMKIFIREANDFKNILNNYKTGLINIIDLANIYSCPFIATKDIGFTTKDGSFEILGRFDHSDIRGCSLLYES